MKSNVFITDHLPQKFYEQKMNLMLELLEIEPDGEFLMAHTACSLMIKTLILNLCFNFFHYFFKSVSPSQHTIFCAQYSFNLWRSERKTFFIFYGM